MERGPLPRHERTWRHPSELAAEERDVLRAKEAAPSTRVFALTTGTLGLLAVGVLILTVTPRRQESPIAIIATTTPATVADALPAQGETALSLSALAPSFGGRSALGTPRQVETRALATPLGDGRLVVVTRAAIADEDDGTVEVVLPSGDLAVGRVVHGTADALILAVDDPTELGHDVASHRPHDREMVTVLASPPITVAYGDIDELSVDAGTVGEGTAVVDVDGSLVGVCSRSGRSVRLIEITEAIAGATIAER